MDSAFIRLRALLGCVDQTAVCGLGHAPDPSGINRAAPRFMCS